MDNKLKFKSPEGVSVEVSFDPAFPVVIEVISAETNTAVTVKDPTGVSSTQEWIGGRERRG